MRCSMLLYAALCSSALLRTAPRYSALLCAARHSSALLGYALRYLVFTFFRFLLCAALWCSIFCSVLPRAAPRCSVLLGIALCCAALLCVAQLCATLLCFYFISLSTLRFSVLLCFLLCSRLCAASRCSVVCSTLLFATRHCSALLLCARPVCLRLAQRLPRAQRRPCCSLLAGQIRRW